MEENRKPALLALSLGATGYPVRDPSSRFRFPGRNHATTLDIDLAVVADEFIPREALRRPIPLSRGTSTLRELDGGRRGEWSTKNKVPIPEALYQAARRTSESR